MGIKFWGLIFRPFGGDTLSRSGGGGGGGGSHEGEGWRNISACCGCYQGLPVQPGNAGVHRSLLQHWGAESGYDQSKTCLWLERHTNCTPASAGAKSIQYRPKSAKHFHWSPCPLQFLQEKALVIIYNGKSTDTLDSLRHQWFCEKVASKSSHAKLLKIIRCNFQADCSTLRCTCKRHNIECTPACSNCRGSGCTNTLHNNDEDDEDYDIDMLVWLVKTQNVLTGVWLLYLSHIE